LDFQAPVPAPAVNLKWPAGGIELKNLALFSAVVDSFKKTATKVRKRCLNEQKPAG
jgi:hypothetical protein